MTIEERLTQLERKNRRLTLALVVAGLATSLAVAVGMAAPGAVSEEVKAHQFNLVDENGKTRASLGMFKGGPSLTLFDENGNRRAALAVDPLAVDKGNSSFSLFDEKGKPRVELGIVESGGGGIDVYNTFDKNVVSIQAGKANCGAVYVNKLDGSLGHALRGDR